MTDATTPTQKGLMWNMSPNAKVKLAFKKKVLELDSHYESSYLSSLRNSGCHLPPILFIE